MSKELINEIESKIAWNDTSIDETSISLKDVKRLLNELEEQAERVEELEEEIRRIRQMKYHEAYEQGKFDTNMKVWYEMPKLEQQNKRYREALKNIYELAEYDEYDNTLEQIVSEIEKALEGTE